MFNNFSLKIFTVDILNLHFHLSIFWSRRLQVQERNPRYPSPQWFSPAPSGESRGISRPERINNPRSSLWVCLGVSQKSLDWIISWNALTVSFSIFISVWGVWIKQNKNWTEYTFKFLAKHLNQQSVHVCVNVQINCKKVWMSTFQLDLIACRNKIIKIHNRYTKINTCAVFRNKL